MIFEHEEGHSEHEKVIRMDIGTKSVEKCRDVEDEPISGKTLWVRP
jgi:hypothetical protein